MKFNLPSLETLSNNIEIAQYKVRKNSPAILLGLGLIGLGLTVWETYKARDGLREIAEDIEEKRENGEDIDVKDTAIRIISVVAKPTLYGTLSVSAIIGSYHVLTNRINILSSALATATSENKRIRSYLKKNHPDVITAPVDEKEEVYATREDEGKKKRAKTVAYTRKEVKYLEGTWFDKSSEYASDDTHWNETFIETRARLLYNKLAARGFLRLSEVYAALEIPSSEYNAQVAETVGWSGNDYFDLDIQLINISDGTGYSKPVPYIEWPSVRSIVGSIDYDYDAADYMY